MYPSCIYTVFRSAFSYQSRVFKNGVLSLKTKMLYTPVTHIIFDLDGLLLDTEKAYHGVISQIAAQYGKKYTPNVQMKLLGTTEKDTARIAVSEMQLPISAEEFHFKFIQFCKTALLNCPLMDGAETLICHFYKNNIPIALATSSSQESVEIKLRKYKQLFSLFSHKVMATTDPEVKRGKPHPDIFLVCASRFEDNPDPKNCLVFEDAPNGARGAIDAGMQVVMVPEFTTNRALCSHATLILDSLRDFKPELFGLPPFK